MKKKGTLSIEIDKITQCLEDIDGNQLETIAYKIEDVNTLKGYTKKTGWYVNWAKLYKEYNIFALALSNSPSVFQGLNIKNKRILWSWRSSFCDSIARIFKSRFWRCGHRPSSRQKIV